MNCPSSSNHQGLSLFQTLTKDAYITIAGANGSLSFDLLVPISNLLQHRLYVSPLNLSSFTSKVWVS